MVGCFLFYLCFDMKRRPQLDFFRGIFLILITVDHFLTDDNIIKRFTYGFVGWVTAAEGFVFLSGLTAGIVYTYKSTQKGQRFITVAAMRRAWQIYRNHIIILFLVYVLVLTVGFIGESWADKFSLLYLRPGLAALLGLTLLYQPYYNDVLPMYAIFVLLVPAVIKLFKRGYVRQVFTASALLYLLGIVFSLYNLTDKVSWYKAFGRGHYNLFSWQLLFLAGLYSGFAYFNGKTKNIQINKKIFYFSSFLVVVLFIAKNTHIDDYRIVQYLVDGAYVAPLRLLNFWVLFMTMVFLATRYPQKFNYRPLCYLGQYSLEVFSLHIVLVILFRPLENYLNTFHAIKLSSHFYFQPFSSLLLLFLILPALYLAPVLLSARGRAAWRAGRAPASVPQPRPVAAGQK